MSIISRCELGYWKLVTSDVIDYELSRMEDTYKLEQVQGLCRASSERLEMTKQDKERAEHFQRHGIKPMDSYHLSIAEASKIDVFLTTDRKLLNSASKLGLAFAVKNPVSWLMEVIDYE